MEFTDDGGRMSSSKDEAKKLRRRELMAARADMGEEGRAAVDAAITDQVKALPEYQQADLVLPYLSFGAEIDTRAIIRDAWSKGKTVALPRCVEGTRDMRWYRVESFDGLVRSRYGVDEPAEDPAFEVDPSQSENAVALVPGLEFDRQGYRLGYGGGFYDMFLAVFRGVSVGLCRSKFLQDDPIDRDVHDLSVGIIVTDAEVVRL